MTTPDSDSTPDHRCPSCGADLRDTPTAEGLCPQCLLQVGLQEGSGDSSSNAETLAHTPPGEEPSGPPPGTRLKYFGDYEIIEEIARGGMGVVYRARQRTLNRTVALKMIVSGQLASEEAVQRFLKEAEAAANLQHPGIVAIHEVGEHDGQHYFTMDYVEGVSLAQSIRHQPLSPSKAAEYVCTIAEAVHYAHQQGTVHRDLKPSNILIDSEGRPRVTDFGLAKRIEGNSQLTASGAVLGTPSYMPPEQAVGKSKTIDARSDVYSLGAILYELVTGRPPFRAETPLETVQQVIEAEPVAPRLLSPKLSRDLETIILKCLAKEPGSRYRTAQALADDLTAFRVGRNIQARRPGIAERAVKWFRRQRRGVALTVAAAVVTFAVVVGSLLGWMGYREWRLGYLAIDTDAIALVADVLDSEGRVVAGGIGVPTEDPIPLAAGNYRLRVSGRRNLSQTFELVVERGRQHKFRVSLEGRRLWEPLELERKDKVHMARLAKGGAAGHDLVVVHPNRLRRLDGSTAESVFDLDPGKDPKLTGLRWAWSSTFGNDYLDSSPRPILPPGKMDTLKIDADDTPDLVFALRKEAALVAFSGETGAVLWVYQTRPPTAPEQKTRPSATCVGTPAVTDIDLDGTPDFIATFAAVNRAGDGGSQVFRWVEAISGRSGARLWSLALEDSMFRLEPPTKDGKWLVDYRGRGWRGNEQRRTSSFRHPPALPPDTWGDLYRRKMHFSLSGNWIAVPFAPHVVLNGGQTVLAMVAGSYLIGVELRTGAQLWRHDIGSVPARAPEYADVNGDGSVDALLLKAIEMPTDPEHSDRVLGSSQLVAQSLESGIVLWTADIGAEWGAYLEIPHETPASWPLVVDLDLVESVATDAEGLQPRILEIVVPHGEPSVAHDWMLKNVGAKRDPRRWGGVRVLDGRDGKVRWTRSVKTLNEQINRIAVGPDIDGDGQRDLFAASLASRGGRREQQLSVDAFSGRSGASLWVWTQSVKDHPEELVGEGVGPLRWWNLDSDGHPQLVVPYTPRERRAHPALYVLSVGAGRLAHVLPDLPDPELADLNGDGALDLCAFRLRRELVYFDYHDPERELIAFAGAPLEWRILGTNWRVHDDFNGDGIVDVLATVDDTSARLTALSGHDGRLLWKTPASGPVSGVPPAWTGDLNADGTPDLVIGWRGLTTFDGRDGTQLWRTELRERRDQPKWRSRRVDIVDLDGDGRGEALAAAIAPRSGTNEAAVQWIAVDGPTGSIRWRAALSRVTLSEMWRLNVEPAFADLTGDGVQDGVVPVLVAGTQAELSAVSGRDGKVIWKHPLAPRENTNYLLRGLPAATISDLDDDGRSEVLFIDFRQGEGDDVDVKTAPKQLRVVALDGAAGREKWTWEETVGAYVGRVRSEPHWRANLPRPLAVTLRRGRAVCAWSWVTPRWQQFREDGTSTSFNAEAAFGWIVMLSSDGEEMWRRLVKSGTGKGKTFRVWNADLDADGADELIFPDEGKLHVVRAGDGSLLWEHKLAHGRGGNEVFFRAHADGTTVVVRAGGQRVLFGLAGATGDVLWRSREMPGWFQVEMLSTPAGTLPRMAYRGQDGTTLCRLPVTADVGRGLDLATAGSSLARSERVSQLPSPPDDPRTFRPLPWRRLFARTGSIVRSVALSMTMYVIPVALIAWLVWKRQRNWPAILAVFLAITLSLVVSGTIVVLNRPLASWSHWVNSAFERATPGLAFVAVPLLFIVWLLRRRWQALAWLVGVHLAFSAVFAAVTLWLDRGTMEVWERYDWSDAYLALLFPVWATGLAVVGFLVLRGMWRGVRWMRRSRSRFR